MHLTRSKSSVLSAFGTRKRKAASNSSSTSKVASNKRAKTDTITADERAVLKSASSLVRTFKVSMSDAGIDFLAHLDVLDVILARPLAQFRPADLKVLKMPVPDIVYPSGKPRNYYWATWAEVLNSQLELAAVVVSKIVDATLVKPSPHSFAQRSVQRDWQEEKENENHLPPIYCGRPPQTSAMTITVLHSIFPEFLRNVDAFTQEISSTRKISSASFKYIDAAYQLCHEMENGFEDETDRSDAFNLCVRSIFKFEREHEIGTQAEKYESCVVIRDEVITLIREDKIDLGEGNDSFMQAARVYEILASESKAKEDAAFTHGVPMFLLTIQGPAIMISGAFCDDGKIIVEPLTLMHLMLPDECAVRQRDLAALLFALDMGMNKIASIAKNPLPKGTFAPDTPRIYSPSLRFARRLSKDRNVFHAFEEDKNFFVKLVPHEYPQFAHKTLAEKGLAPTLDRVEKDDCALNAVVMCYLSPDDGWMPLSEYEGDRSGQAGTKITLALEEILSVLKSNNLVHGDLRDTNIMIKVDKEDDQSIICDHPAYPGSGLAFLNVVDFDWASGGPGSIPTESE